MNERIVLNQSCPICKREIYLGQETADTKKEVCHLDCYLMSREIFTTSMNRKVCWENGFDNGREKGKLEQKKEFLEWLQQLDIILFGKEMEIEHKIKQLSKEIRGMK